MGRTLELDVDVSKSGMVSVGIIQPESGLYKGLYGLYDSDKLRNGIVREIMSWVTLWMDEEEDEDNE